MKMCSSLDREEKIHLSNIEGKRNGGGRQCDLYNGLKSLTVRNTGRLGLIPHPAEKNGPLALALAFNDETT